MTTAPGANGGRRCFSVRRLGPGDLAGMRTLNALYTRLVERKDVMHFEIAVKGKR
jgi:hypothetical protein